MLQRIKNRIKPYVLFLVLCVVLSVVFTFYATANCIDSDASSELVLSNHLAENGGILSADWGYSTELRVVNTQLVYAPLFKIFNDWHMVRFVGALILQAILVGAFFVFTKCTGLSGKVFCISAGLFLLPVSVCYGRIVLYNCYYVPHIAISLIIVGLTFAKWEGKRGLWLIVRTACLLVLSFLGGLGGIRQAMMTHAPVLLAVFAYFVLDDLVCKRKDAARAKKRLVYLLNAVGSAAFFFAGLLINTEILAKKFVFSDYSENMIGLIDVAQFKDIAYGLMHHFGFRDEIKLISVLGVLSILGVFLTVGCLIVAIVQIVKYREHQSVGKALPSVFFLSYLAVMLLVFIVLGNYYYFVLYFTPVVVWFIPVFVQQLGRTKNVPVFNMRRVLPAVVAGIIFCNGVVNGIYFLDHTKFQQKYEGLVFKDREITQTLTPVVDFLVDNGYERGYATFWNGNIITEMSDGAVRMVNVHYYSDTGNFYFNPWLSLNTNRALEGTKDFLLLDALDQYSFEYWNDLTCCELVYQDDHYVIYEIEQ